jgi:transcriptional regulator with XRE-family HTH domain
VTSDDVNPVLRRRELGYLLRKLRTDRGLTVEDVTKRLLISPTKISRLENGRTGVSPRDIRDLCDLYQVTDPAERERLGALAREGKKRAWWQGYSLPYSTYIGLEAEADSISDYNSDVVTGLLQVEPYARAILATAVPPHDAATLEQHVEARLKRQDLLSQEHGPSIHFIVDESALRHHVGGPAVMKSQLERIIEIATSLPKVTFQLIPFEHGAHPGMDTAFVILEFDEPQVNDVVCLEGYFGSTYLENPAELGTYRAMYSRLSSLALSPEESVAEAAKIATTYQ